MRCCATSGKGIEVDGRGCEELGRVSEQLERCAADGIGRVCHESEES